MTFWILAALALYFVQTLLPPTFRFRGDLELVGARDNLPEPSIIGRRAERALVNVGEAMILFLPLAIMSMDNPAAVTGAMVFVLSRVVYVPLYLLGVPYLRSCAWLGGLIGMGMMAATLI